MNAAFLMRAAVAMLFIGFAAHFQSPLVGQARQATSQNSPSPPTSKPTPYQLSSPKSEPLTSEKSDGPTSAVMEKESFSQLTLFLFGGGLALFIALLAWSDQIRGIDQDIREMENRFLERTGIEKQTFLRIVKPKSPDDRGEALLEVVSAGRIKNKGSAEVLGIFTKWHKQWSWIERLSAGKYYLTIALTIALFLVGITSLFTSASQQVLILSLQCRVEMLILILPAMLVAMLLVIIICIAERENALRSFLKSVSDMV
jgi:hypothetical protein